MSKSTKTTETKDICNKIVCIRYNGRKLYYASDMFGNIDCFADKVIASMWRDDAFIDITEVEELCVLNNDKVWKLRRRFQDFPHKELYKVVKGYYPKKGTLEQLIGNALKRETLKRERVLKK